MPLFKELVLRLDVGHNTVIRDVQLWREMDAEKGHEGGPSAKNCLAEVIGMVSVAKLPLWLDLDRRYRCFTTSETSFRYFNAKLMRQRHRNRGILCRIHSNNDSIEYMLFHKCLKTDVDASFEIESIVIDLSTKRRLDAVLGKIHSASDESNATTESISRNAAGPSNATKSIEKILEKNRQQRLQKSNSLNKRVLLNDQHQHFVTLLSQCILSGLRLRGVPQSQYEKLYKMTYKASEFAFRNELRQTTPISFEAIQDCVETLLKLFTKT